jgi:hypothetical protein
LVGDSLVAVGAEMVAAALVYVIVFLAFGLTADERRLYLAKVLAFRTHLRLPARAVSEGA